MYTKKQRVAAWQVMAVICVFLGAITEVLAEIYLPGGWFQKNFCLCVWLWSCFGCSKHVSGFGFPCHERVV